MTSDPADPISAILRRLQLKAEIFQHAHYCGNWAVDTSGLRTAPFHLIQKGDCWLHQEGSEPKRLTPGNLVVLPKDGAHIISPSAQTPRQSLINQAEAVPAEDADNIMLCGFFEFASRATWPLLESLPDAVILDQKSQKFEDLVRVIFAELESPSPGSEAMLENLAQGLFIFVLRAAIEQGASAGLLEALLDPRLGKALALIHADPGAPLDLKRLTTVANMSRSAFVERFRKLTGDPPMRYLQRWRLQVARDLLLRSSETVSAIAEQVGYASEVSFRQTFRKEMGMTPSEVRRSATADQPVPP